MTDPYEPDHVAQLRTVIECLEGMYALLTEIRDRLPAPDRWKVMPLRCPVHNARLEPGYWTPPKHAESGVNCSYVSDWPAPTDRMEPLRSAVVGGA